MSSALLLVLAGTVRDATAVPDTRTLSFYHTHSEETLTVTFKRDGRYDEEGLKKLNWFLRDWRSQDQTKMAPRLFDILWEVYRDVDGKQPIQIISAYRAPATNSMLRRRSSGVARHSLHMQGMAMDFFIPGVSLERDSLRRPEAAARRRRLLPHLRIAFRPSRRRQCPRLAAPVARTAGAVVP